MHFTVYVRDTWRPIGNTSLMEIDRVHRAATFGLLIGEPDARGLGYGTEATRLVPDYAFTALGLHSVSSSTSSPTTWPACGPTQKAGFKEVGRRR